LKMAQHGNRRRLSPIRQSAGNSEHPIIDNCDVLFIPGKLQLRPRPWWHTKAGIVRTSVHLLWCILLIAIFWRMPPLHLGAHSTGFVLPAWLKGIFTLIWLACAYLIAVPPRVKHTLLTVEGYNVFVKGKRVGVQNDVEFISGFSSRGFTLFAIGRGSAKKHVVYSSINPFAIRELQIITTEYLVQVSVNNPISYYG